MPADRAMTGWLRAGWLPAWLRRRDPPMPRAMPPRLGPAPFPALAALGESFPPYQRIFPGEGRFLDPVQAAIAGLPVQGGLLCGPVGGFLRPDDALALHEIAACSRADVLELGCYLGLSTAIMGAAIRASGGGRRVVSVEIEPSHASAAAATMARLGLAAAHAGLCGDAGAILPRLIAERRRFGAAFIDHDHGYAATRLACDCLAELLHPGAIAVFHDFNDARNRTEPEVYGIYRALSELVARPGFVYLGMVGCCALVMKDGAE